MTEEVGYESDVISKELHVSKSQKNKDCDGTVRSEWPKVLWLITSSSATPILQCFLEVFQLGSCITAYALKAFGFLGL